MTENLLKHETSPYLRQHADNPVHWRAWGPEAFEEARRTDRPVLLSVGYAACHWCHVMAHESFEDESVAAVMNDLYVNIKVDREERPDVDQLYMNALQLLGEQGGWPLTMFLTPDGDPVWGGTYFPKTPRYGRPGFVQVLQEFARLYREEPDRISHNSKAIRAHLAQGQSRAGEMTAELIGNTASQLARLYDPIHGGIRGAPKFPQPSLQKLLWQTGRRTGDSRYFEIVEHTLSRMSRGGIYDHLGGGFSRYSVDERWLVPHFEKMLYDNAQLVDLLTLAWLRTGIDLFRERIVETAGWIFREMTTESGAFAASLDADSAGEEGLFYTWTPSEISELLREDADFFSAAYGVTAEGNFEGRSILNRLADPFPLSPEGESRLEALRGRLLEAREERIRPGRDDKVLADWNGLAISALARAASAVNGPGWLDRAKRAYRFIADSMVREDRIAHSTLGAKTVFPGLSSDGAAMIQAALALYEATQDRLYLGDAERWTKALCDWHWDAADGGFFLAAADAQDISIRLKQAQDDSTPNPNAVMAENLVRLWHLTGNEDYRKRCDALLEAFGGAVSANPLIHAGLISALDLRLGALQIVVAGDPADAAHTTLASAARSIPDPNRVVMIIGPEEDLPPAHPAAGKGPVDGRAAAYVCLGETCSLPVTEASRLPEAATRAEPVAGRP